MALIEVKEHLLENVAHLHSCCLKTFFSAKKVKCYT
ncbi:MAG: hypothetical protein JWM14_2293 [Chitinophagaceae bacterium]|nr:hypothetical protein [Chitinophagaceae bacterium]